MNFVVSFRSIVALEFEKELCLVFTIFNIMCKTAERWNRSSLAVWRAALLLISMLGKDW